MTSDFELPSQVFKVTYNAGWKATLQALKIYDLEVKNQESGVIKTRWIENTADVNFSDSFGNRPFVKAAKFKLIVNVSKGFAYDREVSKITVYRRQMIERDFLQGWQLVPSDNVLEKTVLYRIARIIDIRNKINKIEAYKNKQLEKVF